MSFLGVLWTAIHAPEIEKKVVVYILLHNIYYKINIHVVLYHTYGSEVA